MFSAGGSPLRVAITVIPPLFPVLLFVTLAASYLDLALLIGLTVSLAAAGALLVRVLGRRLVTWWTPFLSDETFVSLVLVLGFVSVLAFVASALAIRTTLEGIQVT